MESRFINELYNGWQIVNTMLPSELKSIPIITGNDGFIRYGYETKGGVIFINTLLYDHDPKLAEQYNNWMIKTKKDKLLTPFKIYRACRELYNPVKAELDSVPSLNERLTIFWQSEVYYNGKEPVKIKYPNLKREGPVMITINGVSDNSYSGTGKAIYKVIKSIKE